MTLESRYDDAMFDFSQGQFDQAIEKLSALVAEAPTYFDAQLSLGMAYYRKGDYARAIEEGHKAERLQPNEQLVHTNLSLFYMKSGDKKTAEHHGLQARIASWKTSTPANARQPQEADPELQIAKPKMENVKVGVKLPDMPWKKNARVTGAAPDDKAN